MCRPQFLICVGLILACGSPAAADEPLFPSRWNDASAVPWGRDVRLSAAGGRRLVGSMAWLRVWRRPNGESFRLHAAADTAVYGPRFSPDGRRVVGVRGSEPDWQLVVWDAATGKETRAEPRAKRDPA